MEIHCSRILNHERLSSLLFKTETHWWALERWFHLRDRGDIIGRDVV